ncbi:MAG: class I SAM-dependent methyltransferase [Candidatus Limnocylindrales bacterium]
MSDPRTRARELARAAEARGDPSGWFEQLYVESERDGFAISWVDLAPNPYLVAWLDRQPNRPRGRALVVGCGYGDDAEFLADHGLEVTAFDVAPSAVARCRSRFPDSHVTYAVADAITPPAHWTAAFDFIFEAYTIQVLHGEARAACAESIGRMVAPGGRLLVVARSRKEDDPIGTMPWPLTRAEVDAFGRPGLDLASLTELVERGDPPVPRFIAEFVARG